MALISTLSDNFDDNSTDTAKWTVRIDNGTVAEQNSRLEVAAASTAFGYGGYTSFNRYDLTGSRAYVHMVQPTASVEGAETYLKVFIDDNNEISLLKGGGSFIPRIRVNGTNTDEYPAYDAAVHKWWSIREEAGTIYYETSTDGTTWTLFKSRANPFTAAQLANCRVDLIAGQYQATTGTGTAIYDNFNTTGAAPAATKKGKLHHNGTAWVEKPLMRHDGINWVQVNIS